MKRPDHPAACAGRPFHSRRKASRLGRVARALALGAALALPFAPVAPDALLAQSAAAPAADTSARSRAIDRFLEEGLAVDPSFHAVAKAEARERIAALRGAAAAMSDAEFELALAGIAALAGNGHTQVLPAPWQARFPRLAVRFLVTDDGLHVMDAGPGLERIIGARVTEVDGRGLAALRDAWSRYAPGRVDFRDESLPIFLEIPAMLHAAGVAARADRVTLRLDSGEELEVGTYGDWPDPEGIWAYLPAPRELELAAAGRVRELPLFLRDPRSYFRFESLPERDAVYLQFRANIDFDGATDLHREATRAIERLRLEAPRYVIVDQRFNIGGDLNNTRELMEAIPAIVPEDGAVFAITSGRTFSAGIASLGYLQQAARGAVTIVGEPVGDELEFWAEGSPVELPTGTQALFATERHDYRTGCPEPDCHGSIRDHPIRVDTLEPAIRPRFTWEDLIAGRDPFLEAVFARMSPPGPREE